jgi:CzcA family heavy metal efflux pump
VSPRGVLGSLIVGSLRHRFAVLSIAALLASFGLFSLRGANYDVFPDFAPPQASIQVEAPGLSPEQVETLVTRPIESAIAGVPGVVAIRSNSIQGLAIVTIVFDAASDVFRVRQQLTEAMTGLAKQLPEGVEDPRLTPLTSSTGTVMIASVTSDVASPMRLRTVTDWTIRPRLLAVPGVAKLTIFGGEVKQYQIGIDPARLARFNLSLEDVQRAAQRTLGVRGAGFIDNPNQRIVIQARDDASAISRLKGAVVAQRGPHRLTLGEVATVSAAAEPPIGASLIDGRPGIQIIVSAQYGANTVKVAAGVDRVIAELNRELAPDGITIRGDVFRPARFIQTALGNLGEALIIGGLLVTGVVFLFLWNLRMVLIALTAIPLSLLAAAVTMNALGYSLNTMTLGGLAIAVGLLVDDAVIVLENVYRRSRENRAADSPAPRMEVVAAATYEVRSAVVFATLAIALMFAPVLSIQDVAGRLFGPLGLAYILATLASLAVALTVTPALCSVLIDLDRVPVQDPPIGRGLKHRYRTLLGWVDRRLIAVTAVAVGIAVGILSTVPSFGTSFIPELKEGHYVALMTLAPGSSLDASTRLGARVADALLKVPHVRLVAQRTGRADKADDVFGTNYSELEIDLAPTDAEGQERAEAGIRSTLRHFPGATFAVRTFLSDRLDEVISGYTAPVIVRAAGTDLDALDSAAAQIAGAITTVKGAVDVRLQNPTGVPELSIVLDDQALARWGFDALNVLEDVAAAYRGAEVGKVYQGDRVFDAAILLDADLRRRPESVSGLMLKAPSGTFVRLGELAGIRQITGRYGVLHEGGRRVQIVTADTRDENIGAFAVRVKEKIAALRLPPGVTVELAGAAEAQSRSMTGLLINSCLAAGGMVLLLSFTISRPRNLALVFLNLPFAMVGGIVAVLATGAIASLGALVGFATLFGITLRNSIMMIAHYEHVTQVEGRPWSLETAIEGAADRFSPILMTSLATALGLLPLALGSGAPGREIEGPMAIVILGGLISSAALNLLVLPALALRWGKFDRLRPAGEEGSGHGISLGTIDSTSRKLG